MQTLNEVYHVDTTFYVCINDIYRSIVNRKSEYFYAGWCYDNSIGKNSQCLKIENIEQIKGHPIYINVINDPNSNYFSIAENKDKTGDEPIIISFNEHWHISDENIKYALAHEFQHCLEMFVKNDHNFIETDKTVYLDDDKMFKMLDADMQRKIRGYCYYFSLAEQRARLNSVINYCINEKPYIKNKNFQQLAAYILFETNHLTYLREMQFDIEILRMDLEKGDYKRLFFFGYFYKLYGDDPNRKNIRVCYEDLVNYDRLLEDNPYNVYEQSKAVFELIEENMKNFYQKLVENIRVNYIDGNIKK